MTPKSDKIKTILNWIITIATAAIVLIDKIFSGG